jgi:hypothetical protein
MNGILEPPAEVYHMRTTDQTVNVVCTMRTIHKHNCGWLRPCTLGDFSLLVQRKVTKRNDTPEPPTSPCASRESRRSPNSQGACTRGAPIRGAPVRRHGSPPDFHECSALPSGSNTRLASSDFPCDALRRLRGPENTMVPWFSLNPYGAPEHRQALGERPQGRAPGSARLAHEGGSLVGPARVPKPRNAGEVRHPGRAFFWFLFFARAKKRNLPWVSHPQVCAAEGRSTKNF